MRHLIAVLCFFAAAGADAASRVVLVSIDAGTDVILDRYLASDVLKGGAFERIARRGAVAKSMTPAAVSSTPVSHPTLFTGAWPSTHGITGVSVPGDDLGGDLRSGFSLPTSVPRLWNVAQAAGKRVVCIAAPGAEATSPESTCTETVPFNAIAPPPNGPLATRGEITEEEFVAREERFADDLSSAVKTRLARDDWDLLMVYIPLIDSLAHRYLLEDARQIEYGDEGGARRKRFAGFIERGYRKIDAVLAAWIAESPGTNFIVVSDHGMIPTHSVVLLNNTLAAGGLRAGGSDAQVRAISSGASAQVYVNAKSRFAGGTVADHEVPAIVAKVVNIVRAIRDPRTGRPVFRTVATGEDLIALNLKHAHAGDVYVSAEPGWGTSGRFDPAVPVIVPSTLSPDARKRVSRSRAEERFLERGGLNELSAGVHGHRPGDPRMQAIFYAIGPDVPRRRLGTVAMVDVAPTVLRVMGVAVPSFMAGRPIW
jgi:predicted AlkP superfamily phosphohydrolase/phosphomutase